MMTPRSFPSPPAMLTPPSTTAVMTSISKPGAEGRRPCHQPRQEDYSREAGEQAADGEDDELYPPMSRPASRAASSFPPIP